MNEESFDELERAIASRRPSLEETWGLLSRLAAHAALFNPVLAEWLREMRAALESTSLPLPQTLPQHLAPSVERWSASMARLSAPGGVFDGSREQRVASLTGQLLAVWRRT